MTLIDIAGRSKVGAHLVSCVLCTKAVARLPVNAALRSHALSKTFYSPQW